MSVQRCKRHSWLMVLEGQIWPMAGCKDSIDRVPREGRGCRDKHWPGHGEFVWWVDDLGLGAVTNGEPLKGFKQGSNMI